MSTSTFHLSNRPGRGVRLAIALLFVVSGFASSAEETNTVSAPTEPAPADTVSSYLQLQAQLHATQLALEQNRKEFEALAARNAEVLALRLEQLEQALATQHARELEASRNADRLLLAVASAFAGLGFIALLLTAYFQWRTVNRLAGFSAVLAGATRLALPGAVGPLAGDTSNTRLLGALNRLEQRLLELEHPAQLGRETEPASASATSSTAGPAEAAATDGASRIAILLAKGQSLLSLGQPGAALSCFDEILAQCPDHPEALVKKGLAFEHQHDTEDALRCYDRAIAVKGDLTQAYLQKAGLCSRLERYDQAVECYERVLRVQEKRLRA